MEKCPFWTVDAQARLRVAQSFAEVGQIALDVLMTFPAETHGRIAQVCGPISTGGFGIEMNRKVFSRAIELLRRNSELVFDQMPLESAISRLSTEWRMHPHNQGEYCWPILHDIYQHLFASGSIGVLIVLPGAAGSTGTRWEQNQGRILGMTIKDYPDYLYQQILEEHGLVSA